MNPFIKRTLISLSCLSLIAVFQTAPAYASFQQYYGPSIPAEDGRIPNTTTDTTLPSMPSISDTTINEEHKGIALSKLEDAKWDIKKIEFLSETPLPSEPPANNILDASYAEYMAIQKASKEADFAGYQQYQKNLRDLTAQFPGKRISGIGVTYQMHFIFDETNKNTLVGAYIQPSIASPYGFNDVFSITATPTDVDNAIKSFLKNNKARSSDATAALDFPMGLRSSNEKYNRLFINKFRAFGWKDTPTTLYHNTSTLPLTERDSNIGYFYFSSAQTLQGLKASSSVNLLPNTMPKQTLAQMNAYPAWAAGWRSEAQEKEQEAKLDPNKRYLPSFSEFYFAEKKYKLNNTQSFYVDFVMDFQTVSLNDQTNTTKPAVAYAFLVVKPAKKNKLGKLDRFIYAPNTKLSTIESDMKLYFAGKTPKYQVK